MHGLRAIAAGVSLGRVKYVASTVLEDLHVGTATIATGFNFKLWIKQED